MRISIIGTAGIPANYGGFETLVQNLSEFHFQQNLDAELIVYCSANNYKVKCTKFLNTELRYLPLNANGIWSIPYDIWSILKANWNHSDTILILGVSGAIALPALRLISRARVVTNIDGVEWRREKWSGFPRWFLRLSERFAVKYSSVVIADNAAIASYVQNSYGVSPTVIAYGGDHAVAAEALTPFATPLPTNYVFSVCRIEPENNIHLILEAFSRKPDIPLVIVGNWDNSAYGRDLRSTYGTYENLHLLDPVYQPGTLKYLRLNSLAFIHGHSAGGTNPSLVEAMHFGKLILAFDCEFNRSTTEESCLYFSNEESLRILLSDLEKHSLSSIGLKMKEIAEQRYTWEVVARSYFDLLTKRSQT